MPIKEAQGKRNKTVYLAGKITGDAGYKEKFKKAQEAMEFAGFVVLSPTILPEDGFTYNAYMRMTTAMLLECDAVCMLPGWKDSPGARCEYDRARQEGKEVMEYVAPGASPLP